MGFYETEQHYYHFLEPPHAHDAGDIIQLISIPTATLAQLPSPIQEPLFLYEQSVAIVHGSTMRLQEMWQDRHSTFDNIHWLCRVGNIEATDLDYVEPLLHNFFNRFRVERTYLLDEVVPDWKHKSARLERHIAESDSNIESGVLNEDREMMDLISWFSSTQRLVDGWLKDARGLRWGSFEELMDMYKSHLKSI